MKNRRNNLLKFSQKIGCDCIVAFEPENLFYMTGFWGEAIGLLETEFRERGARKDYHERLRPLKATLCVLVVSGDLGCRQAV